MELKIILLLILMGMSILAMHRSLKAFETLMYIRKYHKKLSNHLPEYKEMVFSTKPLSVKYWLNQCIKKYVEKNQE